MTSSTIIAFLNLQVTRWAEIYKSYSLFSSIFPVLQMRRELRAIFLCLSLVTVPEAFAKVGTAQFTGGIEMYSIIIMF